jgi:hypothetical protein
MIKGREGKRGEGNERRPGKERKEGRGGEKRKG